MLPYRPKLPNYGGTLGRKYGSFETEPIRNHNHHNPNKNGNENEEEEEEATNTKNDDYHKKENGKKKKEEEEEEAVVTTDKRRTLTRGLPNDGGAVEHAVTTDLIRLRTRWYRILQQTQPPQTQQHDNEFQHNERDDDGSCSSNDDYRYDNQKPIRIGGGTRGEVPYPHDEEGHTFQSFKKAFREGKFGIVHTRCVPPRSDHEGYTQILYSAAFGLLEDAFGDMDKNVGGYGGGYGGVDCVGIESSAMFRQQLRSPLLDATFAVFALYTLYQTDPLPSGPSTTTTTNNNNNAPSSTTTTTTTTTPSSTTSTSNALNLTTQQNKVLSALPLGIKAAPDGHDSLIRRSYAAPIRIDTDSFGRLVRLRELALLCMDSCAEQCCIRALEDLNDDDDDDDDDDDVMEETVNENEKTIASSRNEWKCTCGYAQDCVSVLDRLHSNRSFELCEYVGPVSLEGMTGSREYVKRCGFSVECGGRKGRWEKTVVREMEQEEEKEGTERDDDDDDDDDEEKDTEEMKLLRLLRKPYHGIGITTKIVKNNNNRNNGAGGSDATTTTLPTAPPPFTNNNNHSLELDTLDGLYSNYRNSLTAVFSKTTPSSLRNSFDGTTTTKKTRSVTNQEKRVRAALDPIRIDSRRRRRQRWLGSSRLEGLSSKLRCVLGEEEEEEEKEALEEEKEENGSIDGNDDDLEELWRSAIEQDQRQTDDDDEEEDGEESDDSETDSKKNQNENSSASQSNHHLETLQANIQNHQPTVLFSSSPSPLKFRYPKSFDKALIAGIETALADISTADDIVGGTQNGAVSSMEKGTVAAVTTTASAPVDDGLGSMDAILSGDNDWKFLGDATDDDDDDERSRASCRISSSSVLLCDKVGGDGYGGGGDGNDYESDMEETVVTELLGEEGMVERRRKQGKKGGVTKRDGPTVEEKESLYAGATALEKLLKYAAVGNVDKDDEEEEESDGDGTVTTNNRSVVTDDDERRRRLRQTHKSRARGLVIKKQKELDADTVVSSATGGSFVHGQNALRKLLSEATSSSTKKKTRTRRTARGLVVKKQKELDADTIVSSTTVGSFVHGQNALRKLLSEATSSSTKKKTRTTRKRRAVTGGGVKVKEAVRKRVESVATPGKKESRTRSEVRLESESVASSVTSSGRAGRNALQALFSRVAVYDSNDEGKQAKASPGLEDNDNNHSSALEKTPSISKHTVSPMSASFCNPTTDKNIEDQDEASDWDDFEDLLSKSIDIPENAATDDDDNAKTSDEGRSHDKSPNKQDVSRPALSSTLRSSEPIAAVFPVNDSQTREVGDMNFIDDISLHTKERRRSHDETANQLDGSKPATSPSLTLHSSKPISVVFPLDNLQIREAGDRNHIDDSRLHTKEGRRSNVEKSNQLDGSKPGPSPSSSKSIAAFPVNDSQMRKVRERNHIDDRNLHHPRPDSVKSSVTGMVESLASDHGAALKSILSRVSGGGSSRRMKRSKRSLAITSEPDSVVSSVTGTTKNQTTGRKSQQHALRALLARAMNMLDQGEGGDSQVSVLSQKKAKATKKRTRRNATGVDYDDDVSSVTGMTTGHNNPLLSLLSRAALVEEQEKNPITNRNTNTTSRRVEDMHNPLDTTITVPKKVPATVVAAFTNKNTNSSTTKRQTLARDEHNNVAQEQGSVGRVVGGSDDSAGDILATKLTTDQSTTAEKTATNVVITINERTLRRDHKRQKTGESPPKDNECDDEENGNKVDGQTDDSTAKDLSDDRENMDDNDERGNSKGTRSAVSDESDGSDDNDQSTNRSLATDASGDGKNALRALLTLATNDKSDGDDIDVSE